MHVDSYLGFLYVVYFISINYLTKTVEYQLAYHDDRISWSQNIRHYGNYM